MGSKLSRLTPAVGDPELINVQDSMEGDVDYADALARIATGELREDSIRYKDVASAMIYLISPDYGYRKGPAYEFELDPYLVDTCDVNLRFAASEKISDHRYRTVGSSRSVGLLALGNTPWEAREHIMTAIHTAFRHPLTLDYRQQIAQQAYIESLEL